MSIRPAVFAPASVAAAVTLAACATGPDIKTDVDPAADFSGYHSYVWIYQQPPHGMSPLVYQRVRDSIDRSLAARGFQQGSPGDFAVAFTVGARDKIEVDDFGAYGPYVGRWGYGWGGYNTQVRQFTEGSLAIDVYDVKTHKPVWHGLATQEVTGTVSQAGIDTAVDAVLAKFPAGAPLPAPGA